MAKVRSEPNVVLAKSLAHAYEVARNHIVRSKDLRQRNFALLKEKHYISEIIKGWYVLGKPEMKNDGTTAWYSNFWSFLEYYLSDRFGVDGYCLSAESSLNILAGETVIPRQIIILTKKKSNTTVDLPADTSIFLRTMGENFPNSTMKSNGINILSIPEALAHSNKGYYTQFSENIEMILKASDFNAVSVAKAVATARTIKNGEYVIGALEHLGLSSKAKVIKSILERGGHTIVVSNPFVGYIPILRNSFPKSPHCARIEFMWMTMRDTVLQVFNDVPKSEFTFEKSIEHIKKINKEDAYHSLSIEGYRVTKDLIRKIASGEWNPVLNSEDQNDRNAMSASGYLEAFNLVREAIEDSFKGGERPGVAIEGHIEAWYLSLFMRMVEANFLKYEQLIGYRNQAVYISTSQHVPPSATSLIDCMETFFKLLNGEKDACVRAILGHYIFVFIHPYTDGNGRTARFIMNYMFVTGGLNWTVVRTDIRDEYMNSLENASVKGDITSFCELIKKQMLWDAK